MALYLSGLLFFLLDSSLICGQTTQEKSSAIENNSLYLDSNATYEDQENFQNQEHYHHYSHCFEDYMREVGEKFCWPNFNNSMMELGEENWCDVEMVVRSYHVLTDCLESTSKYFGCYYPNRVVEQLFVMIHQQYFQSCSDEEELPDAPAGVVLAATLLPIILIPFIVYIVVWKSSLRD